MVLSLSFIRTLMIALSLIFVMPMLCPCFHGDRLIIQGPLSRGKDYTDLLFLEYGFERISFEIIPN